MKICVVLFACLTPIAGCGVPYLHEKLTAKDGTVREVTVFAPHLLTDGAVGKFSVTPSGTVTLTNANSKSDVSGQDLLNALMLLNSLRGGAVIVPTTQP